MNKPPDIGIVVPEPVVVKARLGVMPLALEADALIRRLAPHARVVGCFWRVLRFFSVFQLAPTLEVARVIRHPLRQVI